MFEYLNKQLTNLVLKLIPRTWEVNDITWFRLILIPLVWILYVLNNPLAVTVMFAFLTATAVVYEAVAYVRETKTYIGRLPNTGCNLILIWSTASLLLWNGDIQFQTKPILFWLLVLMLAREVVVFVIKKALRVKNTEVQMLRLAKLKTALLMVGIGLQLGSTVSMQVTLAAEILLWIAAACSLISGFQHIRHFYQRDTRRW